MHSPLQAPAALLQDPACASIADEDRKIFCTMVLVTDDMVQNTFKVMEDTGVKDNTLVVFSGDNGGNPSYVLLLAPFRAMGENSTLLSDSPLCRGHA